MIGKTPPNRLNFCVSTTIRRTRASSRVACMYVKQKRDHISDVETTSASGPACAGKVKERDRARATLRCPAAHGGRGVSMQNAALVTGNIMAYALLLIFGWCMWLRIDPLLRTLESRRQQSYVIGNIQVSLACALHERS
jgi:hypothetical protein